MEVGGSYFRVIKVTMVADKVGQRKRQLQLINSVIWIKGAKEKCVNEVKRSQFLIDLNQTPDLELRKGDVMVAYL